ncbi:unnamed protein product, partial [Acanthoscelides obtectus]
DRVKSDKAYRRVNRTTTVFKRIIYYAWHLLAKSKSFEDYIFPAQANNCRSLHPVSQFEVKLRAVLLMLFFTPVHKLFSYIWNSKKKMSKVNNKKKQNGNTVDGPQKIWIMQLMHTNKTNVVLMNAAGAITFQSQLL